MFLFRSLVFSPILGGRSSFICCMSAFSIKSSKKAFLPWLSMGCLLHRQVGVVNILIWVFEVTVLVLWGVLLSYLGVFAFSLGFCKLDGGKERGGEKDPLYSCMQRFLGNLRWPKEIWVDLKMAMQRILLCELIDLKRYCWPVSLQAMQSRLPPRLRCLS